jgi:hypothetical protein
MGKQAMQEVCPVCASTDIYFELGGYAGKIYRCKNCDYRGALVVEADAEMIEAIAENYRKGRDGAGGHSSAEDESAGAPKENPQDGRADR